MCVFSITFFFHFLDFGLISGTNFKSPKDPEANKKVILNEGGFMGCVITARYDL